MIYIIIIILILEQLLYLFLSPFVCRYGIRITSIPISVKKSCSIFNREITDLTGIKLRIQKPTDEIYFRYSYPIFMWGPLLFVGQVKKEKPNVINVRIGILTAVILILLLISNSIKSDFSFYNLLNNGVLVVLIIYFFARFRSNIYRNLVD
jgi:hypothetical protein